MSIVTKVIGIACTLGASLALAQEPRDHVSLTSNVTLMETQNNAFAFVNIRLVADQERRPHRRGHDRQCATG